MSKDFDNAFQKRLVAIMAAFLLTGAVACAAPQLAAHASSVVSAPVAPPAKGPSKPELPAKGPSKPGHAKMTGHPAKGPSKPGHAKTTGRH
ncbi:MAG TPA: hypothetical protein VGN34_15085 [Ktedonobacteraceae bacterium]